MSLSNLWTLIKADLERARNALPQDVIGHEAMNHYQEFLRENELGLACATLEDCAEGRHVDKEFWLALRDAATKMGLAEEAIRYEKYAAI
jgi:hypothetical protein